MMCYDSKSHGDPQKMTNILRENNNLSYGILKIYIHNSKYNLKNFVFIITFSLREVKYFNNSGMRL